ncbi:astacin [Ancylostoma caninum]|uniref:Metalloendopeptidase n=1 Tax=Ancylostoma caninum TaxID=29170 RepID=A0A368GK30_ANCCA|nr:astacin [Ancylostoma caninum]
MLAIGITLFLCWLPAQARVPTLRDLVDPSEQLSLRDTLSKIVEFEYKDQVISSDDVGVLPAYMQRLPTINQLNQNYSDILYQGDIRMPTKLLRSILIGAYNREKRTAYRDRRYPSTIWKRGVPFAFHRSMNREGRRSVLAAIQYFRKFTCIRFRRRTTEPVYLLFVGHDQGCWSTVGRDASQRQQFVSIGRGCEAFGITSHEVAHALGLFHEQSRYDRDNWITVYPQRIPQSQLYNFAKVTPKQMSTYGTPYDIGSVMHYTPFEFSIDPTVPSMVAININEQGGMGQLAGPSYLDVQKLNAHYACGSE